jgi:hypothetical protein
MGSLAERRKDLSRIENNLLFSKVSNNHSLEAHLYCEGKEKRGTCQWATK